MILGMSTRIAPHLRPARTPSPHVQSGPAMAMTRHITFPTVPLTVIVELALGADLSASPTSWTWTDITGYVLHADGIVISRGRSAEANQTEPSTCRLTLSNAGGRFTPRNPTGPYYGQLRRNTPLRVRVNAGTGVYTRFTGYVSEWPPKWDLSGADHRMHITATGILRRLGQGSSPVRSTLHSQVLNEAEFGSLVAYWPCEDGSATSTVLPAYGDVSLTSSGVTYASITAPAGSDSMPDLSAGGTMRTATQLPASASTEWRIEWLQLVDAVGTDHYPVAWTTTGTAVLWKVRNDSIGTVVLEAYSTAGAELLAGAVTASVSVHTSEWTYITVSAYQSGADIALTLDVTDVTTGTSTIGFATLAANTIGGITTVQVNPARVGTSAGLGSVGHVSVYNDTTAINKWSALTGYDGWSAALRFAGVCARAGIAYDTTHVFDDSVAMGPEPRASLITVLREPEAADRGEIVEIMTGELGLIPRTAWENQAVALALDYTTPGHIGQPFEPVDDDRLTRNDASVTRTDGPTARYTDTTGPLGVDVVGRYDEQVTLNLYDDTLPPLLAAWIVNNGTVDEYRYPAIRTLLHAAPDLIPSWLAGDIGIRVTVTNAPAEIAPDGADVLMRGYVETLTLHTWDAELAAVPFAPRRVARSADTTGDGDEFVGYAVPDSCVLAEDLDTTETGVDVTSSPLWSTDADDYSAGVTVVVGGERMTVTAVAGAANPQTLTVTRSANGIVKTHSIGDELTIVYPGVAGL